MGTSSEWVSVLLNCPRDGLVEQRNAMTLAPGASVRLINTSITCPECGHVVLAVDARYEADRRGRITRHIGGGTQRERIEALRHTVEWAQEALQKGTEEAEIVERLEGTIHAQAAPLWRGLARSIGAEIRRTPSVYIVILLTVVGFWIGQTQSVSADEVQQMIDRAVQSHSETPAPTPSPGQPPSGPPPEVPPLRR